MKKFLKIAAIVIGLTLTLSSCDPVLWSAITGAVVEGALIQNDIIVDYYVPGYYFYGGYYHRNPYVAPRGGVYHRSHQARSSHRR